MRKHYITFEVDKVRWPRLVTEVISRWPGVVFYEHAMGPEEEPFPQVAAKKKKIDEMGKKKMRVIGVIVRKVQEAQQNEK
jgi:hypothetical protein